MKNKKNGQVFIFLLRGAAYFAALLMLVLMMQNSVSLGHKLMRYKVYEALNHYYGISILPDIDPSEETMQKLDDALVRFYRATSGEASRLLSVETAVALYDEGVLDEKELAAEDFTITVNARYLEEHPVYDTEGEPVRISGDEEQEFLLIPKQFQDQEAELLTFFKENDTFLKYYNNDVRDLGIEKAHGQKHKAIPIKVIYIMDGQKHDIHNMSQTGKLNGNVQDPLIRVVTEETVSDAQIPAYVTNRDYLIKVENDDEMARLKQTIAETGLEEFIMNIEPADKWFFQNLRYNFTAILVQFLIMVVCIAVVLIAEKRFFKDQSFKETKILLLSWILSFGLYIILLGGLSQELVLSVLLLIIFDFLSAKKYLFHPRQ